MVKTNKRLSGGGTSTLQNGKNTNGIGNFGVLPRRPLASSGNRCVTVSSGASSHGSGENRSGGKLNSQTYLAFRLLKEKNHDNCAPWENINHTYRGRGEIAGRNFWRLNWVENVFKIVRSPEKRRRKNWKLFGAKRSASYWVLKPDNDFERSLHANFEPTEIPINIK